LYYRIESLQAARDYPLISALWLLTNTPDYNSIQHAQMEESLTGEIALSLKEYAATIGIVADDAVYVDLAWGGLNFQNNKRLTKEDKQRINSRLRAEQLNRTYALVTPVGINLEPQR
ncbi:MAG: hypothetical protein M3N42_07095, partial [Cyanobacteriota bacterium]|nr:hypothetical protein [Cyanobacteriota bacterium]